MEARPGSERALGQAVDVDYDVVPNRMLLEHYDEQARRALEHLARRYSEQVLAQLESSRREIASLLDVAFGPIPEEVRAAFERMKADGRAPSPFCVRAT